MEKESPSNAPCGVFNASCDGDIVKDMPNLASDDTRMTNNCLKSSYATSASDDNNSYSYTLTQAGNVRFVDNNCEKESSDLLYYNWPDIGNFEDVDKMLRSCDSSFELGWFSSDQTEGTEEAMKMDFKFPCPEPNGLKNILHRDHDSSESNKRMSSCISNSKNKLYINDQNPTEGKKAGQVIGNDDGSFYQTSELTRMSSNNTFDQVNQHHHNNLQIDYFDHYQSNTAYLHTYYQPSQDNLSAKEHESESVIEGVMKRVEIISSSNVPESSSVSSEVDEISLEATSFRQLRQVMEQLDLRSKLCIRDSLYRLARSAEQRHNDPCLNNTNDYNGPLRSNTCTGFMDIETDTNPIDRSVAHLLFHRPSESLKLPPKPNMNHESMLVCHGEESTDMIHGD